MSKKHKEKQVQPDAVPTLEAPTTETVEQNTSGEWAPGQPEVKYVVTRGGLRVSDKEYPTYNEQRAIAEKEFWQKVVNAWPDGTRIEIVQYDKKKHRIW